MVNSAKLTKEINSSVDRLTDQKQLDTKTPMRRGTDVTDNLNLQRMGIPVVNGSMVSDSPQSHQRANRSPLAGPNMPVQINFPGQASNFYQQNNGSTMPFKKSLTEIEKRGSNRVQSTEPIQAFGA